MMPGVSTGGGGFDGGASGDTAASGSGPFNAGDGTSGRIMFGSKGISPGWLVFGAIAVLLIWKKKR